MRPHGGSGRHARVHQAREREDLGSLAEHGLPFQRHERMQDDVRRDPDRRSDADGRRVEHRRAGVERAVDAAAALHLLGRGEVPARVDAPGLAPVLRLDRLDPALARHQNLDGVGQVVLPADRVLPDPREHPRQRLRREAVDAGVDLADPLLPGGRVLRLDDPAHPAARVAHHAAEVARLGRPEREEDQVETALGPPGDQARQRLARQERSVSRQDEDRAALGADRFECPAGGVPRPERRVLEDEVDRATGERSLDGRPVRPDDDGHARGREIRDRVEDRLDERSPADAVQDLGKRRPHARADARGQDDGARRVARRTGAPEPADFRSAVSWPQYRPTVRRSPGECGVTEIPRAPARRTSAGQLLALRNAQDRRRVAPPVQAPHLEKRS